MYVENNSVLQVCIDKVIWTMPVDHNDEMEMRVNDANSTIRMDEDADRSVKSRNTMVKVVAVPQSPSFYPMFYKMMMEDKPRVCEKKEEKEKEIKSTKCRNKNRKDRFVFDFNKEKKNRYVDRTREWARESWHDPHLYSVRNTNTAIKNEENNL